MAIYEYRAKCIDVVSATVVELGVDLGFGIGTVRKFNLDYRLLESSQVVKDRVKELLFLRPEECGRPVDLLIHTSQQTDEMYMAQVMIFEDGLPLTPGGQTLKQWCSLRNILIHEGLVVPS